MDVTDTRVCLGMSTSTCAGIGRFTRAACVSRSVRHLLYEKHYCLFYVLKGETAPSVVGVPVFYLPRKLRGSKNTRLAEELSRKVFRGGT